MNEHRKVCTFSIYSTNRFYVSLKKDIDTTFGLRANPIEINNHQGTCDGRIHWSFLLIGAEPSLNSGNLINH